MKHLVDERRRHETKVTIYLDEADHVALDEMVLELRRFGLKVDRSRFVREALRDTSARRIATLLRAREAAQ